MIDYKSLHYNILPEQSGTVFAGVHDPEAPQT